MPVSDCPGIPFLPQINHGQIGVRFLDDDFWMDHAAEDINLRWRYLWEWPPGLEI